MHAPCSSQSQILSVPVGDPHPHDASVISKRISHRVLKVYQKIKNAVIHIDFLWLIEFHLWFLKGLMFVVQPLIDHFQCLMQLEECE